MTEISSSSSVSKPKVETPKVPEKKEQGEQTSTEQASQTEQTSQAGQTSQSSQTSGVGQTSRTGQAGSTSHASQTRQADRSIFGGISYNDVDDNQYEQEIYDELEELQDSDPVSIRCNDLKTILNSDSPDKDKFIKLAASYDVPVFDLIRQFGSENGEDLFDKIKSTFSKDAQNEILAAMGREAAGQVVDCIEMDERIDRSGILSYVIGNLKEDQDGCSFAKAFLSYSGSLFDEVYKLDSNVIDYIENSSIDDESKAKLTSNFYQQLINAATQRYAKAASIDPNSKLMMQGASNMCWQAATYNAIVNANPDMAKQIVSNNPSAGCYTVNLGGQEIKLPYKAILAKIGPSSPDAKSSALALAFEQLYPEGTGVKGAFALGDASSSGADRAQRGSLSTFLSQVSGDYSYQTFDRNNSNPLFRSGDINKILDNFSANGSKSVAVASFYSAENPDTIELSDYRNPEVKYKVANNAAHALTIQAVDNHSVTLIDPRNPNQLITVPRDEFCSKVQVMEYCAI